MRLRARPPVAVQRRQQQSADIIPLRLEEVEVSIVVLGGDDASRWALQGLQTRVWGFRGGRQAEEGC